MITGSGLTGFNNLVTTHYAGLGVRCSETDFRIQVDNYFEINGTKEGWNEYLSHLYLRKSGACTVQWSTEKVLLLSIFWGHTEYGHFATLIIDRTRKDQHFAVYADSLPGYKPNAVEYLKDLLGKTGIGTQDLQWIKAEMPRQSATSMDCGPYTAGFSLLYLKALEEAGLLSSSSSAKQSRTVTRVVLEYPSGLNSAKFGRQCRKMMLESMQHCLLDWNNPIFRSKVKFI